GSVKLRTLLHATSALPKNKPIIWRATSVIGRSNESSDRKYWQRCSCILAPLLLLINVPILTAATFPRNASAFKFSGRRHLIAIQHHQKSFSKQSSEAERRQGLCAKPSTAQATQPDNSRYAMPGVH